MATEFEQAQEHSMFVANTRPFMKKAVQTMLEAIKTERPRRSLSVIGFNTMFCAMQMRKQMSNESTSKVIDATRSLIDSCAEHQSLFTYCLDEVGEFGISAEELRGQKNESSNSESEFHADHQVVFNALGSLVDYQEHPLSPKMFNESGNLTVFLFGLSLVTYQWQMLEQLSVSEVHQQVLSEWLATFTADSF